MKYRQQPANRLVPIRAGTIKEDSVKKYETLFNIKDWVFEGMRSRMDALDRKL
jgi:hypothetical protein